MPTKVFDAFTRLDASDVNAYLANKSISNAIINGAFEINQRNYTSSTSGGYGFDRWQIAQSGGTVTGSSQAFTLGAAPLSGLESANFQRIVTSGQSASGNLAALIQQIESVRTFAGQTVTVSFYARAGSGTPKIGIDLNQVYGTGGSPSSAFSTPAGAVTISTSWARYTATLTIPSISGKTLGTNRDDALSLVFWVSAGSDFATRSSSIGIQNNTFDIWGVQVEPGTVANDFRRNANSLQGELAACQRYYFRRTASDVFTNFSEGYATSSATTSYFNIQPPVQMRTSPTSVEFSNIAIARTLQSGPFGVTAASLVSSSLSPSRFSIATTHASSGYTAFSGQDLVAAGTSSSFLGFSAEL
jgi:hypothetical protein